MKMVNIYQTEDHINLSFDFHDERVLKIGDKMEAINEFAYMNGYNWDIFFAHYLAKNVPDVWEGLEADPESGGYYAHWPLSLENQAKAEKFKAIIEHLIQNEEEIYKIVREEGENIEWD
ncbi:MAG: immunity 51 family protein [Turicibacter sp.]|nr:immunity 51 family protein [Turicibacter sp.]